MSADEFVAKMERLTRQERYGDVIFQVEENLKDDPDDPTLLDIKGVAHGMAQEPKKALACFQKITEKHPEIARGWYQTACALIGLNRREEAVEALKKAYEIDPNDASTALNLGVELFNTQADKKKALVFLEQAKRLGHHRAHSVIAEIERLTQNNPPMV